MRIVSCVQGSQEWIDARLGIPTASAFDRIITRARGDLSEARHKYMGQLLAEWFLGHPVDDEAFQYCERGKELEPAAVAAYEFANDAQCVPVGFCLRDDGLVGASPDRFVGQTRRLLEVKCPSIETHLMYMADPRRLQTDYWCQAQGQLYICEYESVDLYSHMPLLPPVTLTLERDDEWIERLEDRLHTFVTELETAKARIAPLRQARIDALRDAQAAYGDGQDLIVPHGGKDGPHAHADL
jgi:hypothetical protein